MVRVLRGMPQAFSESLPAASAPSLRWASVLTVIGCGLLAVDDIGPLKAVGGGTLASPGWIFILAAAGLVVRSGVGLGGQRLLILGLAAAAYGAVVTVLPILFGDLPSELYGESPVGKAVKLGVPVAIWLLVLVSGYLLALHVPRSLLVGVTVALGVMALLAVLVALGATALDANTFLHGTPNLQLRPRSSRFEPSSFGGGFIVLGAIAVTRMKGRIGVAALVVVIALTLLLTSSRGTLVIAVAVLAISALLLVRKRGVSSWRPAATWSVAAVFAVGVVGASLALGVVVNSTAWSAIGLSDAARGTSDATRAGWSEIAVLSLLQHPFGSGFGAYLASMPQFLTTTVRDLSATFPPGSLSELTTLITARDDTGLSPKTLPTLAAVFLGWPGVLAVTALYAAVIHAGLRVSSSPATLPAAVVSVLVSGTYLSSIFGWEQALAFGAILATAASARRNGSQLHTGPHPSRVAEHW